MAMLSESTAHFLSPRAQLSENIPELLQGAADVGAEGVMFDLWWGLCEQEPNQYQFAGYLDLMQVRVRRE